jgi:hypothetical protein
MATTTNFGWETPDDTDLVKDGALAMRTLGNAIDTSLVDLKGGTTGQVLSKTSNTDMDFTWVTSDDANAIQNTIVDAKGDLITATAADTPARLAVGSNGTFLTAASGETTGLKWDNVGWVLLDSGTFSGASVTTATLSGNYRDLRVLIRNFLPATDASGLNLRFNGDTGTNYSDALAPTLGTNLSGANTSTQMIFNVDNATSNGLANMIIPDYANTATYKIWSVHFLGNNATTSTNFNVASGWNGYWKSTSAITSITFLPTSGNFTSGSYLVYGVK